MSAEYGENFHNVDAVTEQPDGSCLYDLSEPGGSSVLGGLNSSQVFLDLLSDTDDTTDMTFQYASIFIKAAY